MMDELELNKNVADRAREEATNLRNTQGLPYMRSIAAVREVMDSDI